MQNLTIAKENKEEEIMTSLKMLKKMLKFRRMESDELFVRADLAQDRIATLRQLKLKTRVSSVKCQFSTIVMIVMHQFEDRCHNSMH